MTTPPGTTAVVRDSAAHDAFARLRVSQPWTEVR